MSIDDPSVKDSVVLGADLVAALGFEPVVDDIDDRELDASGDGHALPGRETAGSDDLRYADDPIGPTDRIDDVEPASREDDPMSNHTISDATLSDATLSDDVVVVDASRHDEVAVEDMTVVKDEVVAEDEAVVDDPAADHEALEGRSDSDSASDRRGRFGVRGLFSRQAESVIGMQAADSALGDHPIGDLGGPGSTADLFASAAATRPPLDRDYIDPPLVDPPAPSIDDAILLDRAVLDSLVLDDAAPGETALNDTAPGETASGETASGESALDDTAISDRVTTVPDQALPDDEIVDRTQFGGALPDGDAAAEDGVDEVVGFFDTGSAVETASEPVVGGASTFGTDMIDLDADQRFHRTETNDVVIGSTADAAAVVIAPSTTAPAVRGSKRLRARKSRRVIRHIDPWSVLTFSIIFHLVFFASLLLAGVLVWNAAVNAGTIENIENFIRELGDYETFQINSDQVFKAAVVIAGMLTLASSVMVVLLTVVFNLVSDLIGGIRVTVLEEETVRVPPKDRR